jgi:hypothetical protein
MSLGLSRHSTALRLFINIERAHIDLFLPRGFFCSTSACNRTRPMPPSTRAAVRSVTMKSKLSESKKPARCYMAVQACQECRKQRAAVCLDCYREAIRFKTESLIHCFDGKKEDDAAPVAADANGGDGK